MVERAKGFEALERSRHEFWPRAVEHLVLEELEKATVLDLTLEHGREVDDLDARGKAPDRLEFRGFGLLQDPKCKVVKGSVGLIARQEGEFARLQASVSRALLVKPLYLATCPLRPVVRIHSYLRPRSARASHSGGIFQNQATLTKKPSTIAER